MRSKISQMLFRIITLILVMIPGSLVAALVAVITLGPLSSRLKDLISSPVTLYLNDDFVLALVLWSAFVGMVVHTTLVLWRWQSAKVAGWTCCFCSGLMTDGILFDIMRPGDDTSLTPDGKLIGGYGFLLLLACLLALWGLFLLMRVYRLDQQVKALLRN